MDSLDNPEYFQYIRDMLEIIGKIIGYIGGLGVLVYAVLIIWYPIALITQYFYERRRKKKASSS